MLENLEVPEVLQIPNPCNPAVIADFLMTALLHKQRGMLQAELLHVERQDAPDEIVRWFVRDDAQNEECIITPVRFFRPILARFGHYYMDGQVYGGHARRTLTQAGRIFVCEIFMSNQNWPGCWIRVYVHPERLDAPSQ